MRHTIFEIRYLIAAPFTLILLVYFVALFWGKRRLNLDVEAIQESPRILLFKPWLWPLIVPVGIFIILDALYQVVIGSFLFLDRPRHWLFTGRLSDMKKQGDDRVERFEMVLNENDPGHV